MILDLMAYFVIPAYTLLFAGEGEWFSTNFSVLGTISDRELAFFLWGMVVGWYFHVVLGRLIARLGGGRRERWGKNAALVLLFFALITPYLPHETPKRAAFHVVFAAAAGVLLLVLLVDLLLRFDRKNPQVARLFIVGLGVILAGCLGLLVAVGVVSSALEIFLVVSTAIWTRRLEGRGEI